MKQARCFGGGGPDNSNHTFKYDKLDSKQTTIKEPSEADIKYMMPEKKTMNTWIHQVIAGKYWDPTQDDQLNNSEHKKYSSYNWFGSMPFLQNAFVWNLVRKCFNRPVNYNQFGVYDGLGHENGVLLYRSIAAPYVLKNRRWDYYTFTAFALWMSGLNTLFVLPFAYALCSIPRRWSELHVFTFHAELLPHTEQVVFHKAMQFGELYRVYVDIKNLEKIDADQVRTPLIWHRNFYDQYMCFRCTETD